MRRENYLKTGASQENSKLLTPITVPPNEIPDSSGNATNEDIFMTEPSSRKSTSDANTNNKQGWKEVPPSEATFLQKPHIQPSPGLSASQNNANPACASTGTPGTRSSGNRNPDLDVQTPNLDCCYPPCLLVKNSYYPESTPVETHTFPITEASFPDPTNARIQRQNLQKQVSFDINSLKQKDSMVSVRSPLLGEDRNYNKEQNRHLSDIELLYQVYDELRHKISQSSHDHVVMEEVKITKGIDWKECCLGERMRRWGFWFIVAFLAAMTIRDVILLVIEYMEYPKQSDMNIMFNESMHMPNITFCMSRQQAWSHFILNSSGSAEEWDNKVQEELKKLDTRDSFLDEAWDYQLVIEAYEVIATLNSMERETTAQGSARSINFFRTHPRLQDKRTMVKTWLKEIKNRDVTFDELTQKVGFETIKRSMQQFKRTTFNENLTIRTRFRTSWISTMQFCFQPWFEPGNYYEIEDQGNFFTMLLSHNVDNLEGAHIDCMSVDFHGRPSSLSRFMEGKGRARDGFNDDLCLGIRHEIMVEVRARYVMLENDDNGTACRNSEKVESEFDCRSRCRMEMIRISKKPKNKKFLALPVKPVSFQDVKKWKGYPALPLFGQELSLLIKTFRANKDDDGDLKNGSTYKDMCNCTPPTLSYLVRNINEYYVYPMCDYEKCEIDIENKTYSDQQCVRKCHRFCDQITYEVSHVQQGKMVRRDLTMINLNWGSFEYLTLTQYWVWSMPTFIAALGGSMGAWLGLSILSLIQGSTYLYTFLSRIIKKNRPLLKKLSSSSIPPKKVTPVVQQQKQ